MTWRALGIAVVLIVLLYEPILVSLAGGTIGRRLTNMRVIDDRHGGNVSFPKACAVRHHERHRHLFVQCDGHDATQCCCA